MRRIVPLLSLLLLTAPIAAHAVPLKRVNVQELERLLSAVQGQPDNKVAKLVAGLELTERASSVRVAHWQSEFPGHRCSEAFLLLADSSAFLDLPAADIPATAPPDPQAQRTLLAQTVEYVKTAITRLPDFYATRKTENFQDMPGRPNSINRLSDQSSERVLDTRDSPHEPLLDAGKSSVTVSYVDGQEVAGSKKGGDSFGNPSVALTTHGEFGPILIAVLQDAAKSRVFWSHWEQGTSGTFAVFRYSVAQGQSSYRVSLPDVSRTDTLFPAYHGEIGIDPATGAILRVTLIADLLPPHQHAISSILVEYASVPIGGKSYICPVHGVALARFSVLAEVGPVNRVGSFPATRLETQLNDVAFVDYHQFRAESRVLTDKPIGEPDAAAPPK
jgi:hypothetical protein